MRCDPVPSLIGAIHESPKKTSHARERPLTPPAGKTKIKVLSIFCRTRGLIASRRLAGRRKTLRAYAEPTLPQCHSRACFATARQWRGCGNCWLPLSATGSGSQQFLVFFDRCAKSSLPSSATGSGRPLFPKPCCAWFVIMRPQIQDSRHSDQKGRAAIWRPVLFGRSGET